MRVGVIPVGPGRSSKTQKLSGSSRTIICGEVMTPLRFPQAKSARSRIPAMLIDEKTMSFVEIGLAAPLTIGAPKSARKLPSSPTAIGDALIGSPTFDERSVEPTG